MAKTKAVKRPENDGQCKATSLRVEAFACSQCEGVHRTESEADGCCCCSECGGKFTGRTSYSSQCDGCAYGMDLRNARAEVRREETQLVRSKERLAGLLNGERPAKANPKKNIMEARRRA